MEELIVQLRAAGRSPHARERRDIAASRGLGKGAVIGGMSDADRRLPVGMTARDVPARIKSP